MRQPISNRRTFLYIALLGATILLMVAVRTCSIPVEPGIDQSLKRRGGDTINVAMEFSPIGVYSSGDTLSGFYYDLLRNLSDAHDFNIHITGFSNSADMLDALEKGKIDVLIADMPLTTSLKENFAYTRPVITDRQVLVQLRDSVSGDIPFHSQLDLIGHTLFLPANSPFKSRLENLARELGGEIEVMEHPDYGAEQLVISVAFGEMPNAVVNSRVASILLQDYPQLDMSVELSLNQFQSWLINRNDSTLRDSLDLWLDDFKSTQAFNTLMKQYFDTSD